MLRGRRQRGPKCGVRMLGAGLAALGLVCGAGCAPTPVALPEGVSASIYQQRPDYGPRGLQVTVINGSDAALTVTSAAYVSPRFAGSTVWDRATTVAPGARVNLRVLLGTPVCDAELRGEVEISFTTADGRAGSATLDPLDEFSTLRKVTAEDCLSAGVADVATIEVGTSIRTELRGGRLIGLIDATATPTGRAGTVAVAEVTRTILLRPEADGATGWPLGWTVDASSGPVTTTLAFEPSNCNPHIVAEDKRGTFFPFLVSLGDGTSGTVCSGVSDEVRGQIYSYIAEYCGW